MPSDFPHQLSNHNFTFRLFLSNETEQKQSKTRKSFSAYVLEVKPVKSQFKHGENRLLYRFVTNKNPELVIH